MDELSNFERKLIRLILEETRGETIESGLPSGTTGEICYAMANQLGKFIALQCGGHQKMMSDFLDMSVMAMNEIAGETQAAGQFLANPDNWFQVDSQGVATKVDKRRIKYDQSHWFNQDLARLLVRLMQERGTTEINGQTMLKASYDPEATAMVMTSLSEMLGKAAVLLSDAGADSALINKLLEGATHNAFDVAAKFKARIVQVKPEDL